MSHLLTNVMSNRPYSRHGLRLIVQPETFLGHEDMGLKMQIGTVASPDLLHPVYVATLPRDDCLGGKTPSALSVILRAGRGRSAPVAMATVYNSSRAVHLGRSRLNAPCAVSRAQAVSRSSTADSCFLYPRVLRSSQGIV